MPLFTKSMKMKSINSKRLGRYLLYALGEIILVVAGILIALNINNASEQQKNKVQFQAILNNVSSDLKLDTLNINEALKNFESRKKVLNPIINGKFTDQQFETCIMCGPSITSFVPVNINDKGYLQLKNFYDNSNGVDTLSARIVQFYTEYTKTIADLELEVQSTTIETIKHWRDKYPWFANVRTNQRDERYVAYLKSEDYRNRATYFDLILNNFTLYLRSYKQEATTILETIEAFKRANK